MLSFAIGSFAIRRACVLPAGVNVISHVMARGCPCLAPAALMQPFCVRGVLCCALCAGILDQVAVRVLALSSACLLIGFRRVARFVLQVRLRALVGHVCLRWRAVWCDSVRVACPVCSDGPASLCL